MSEKMKKCNRRTTGLARVDRRLGLSWPADLKVCATTFLAMLFLGSGLRAQTNPDPYDVTHYVIDAELFPSTHLLKAKVQIDFTPSADLRLLALELHSNLRVSAVVDAASLAVVGLLEELPTRILTHSSTPASVVISGERS